MPRPLHVQTLRPLPHALEAFDAWPEGMIAVCFFVGQFLVYGAHWCVGRVVEGGRTDIRVTGDTSSMFLNFNNQFLLTSRPPVVSVSAPRVRSTTFVVYLNK